MLKNIPNIILVDDHELFRDALKTMLELDDKANVIGEAANGVEFLSLLDKVHPDIVLMDIEMPQLNGVEATREAINKFPSLKVLALSMASDQNSYYQMIEAGAVGFLLKTANKTELTEAIDKVYNGSSYFSNELLRKLIVKMGPKKYIQTPGEVIHFNENEVKILKLMCEGLSTQEIADKINLSVKTVENYRVKLLHKTNSRNAISLVVYAIKNQIIQI